MIRDVPRDVTQLLSAWSEGDQAALDQLTPIVYNELRRLARRMMAGERPGHTLQTTAVVHEAYLRLADCNRMQWRDRAHFFAVSSQLMRRILVDYSRRSNLKRGAGQQRVPFEEAAIVAVERSGEFAAIDDALTLLARIDTRKARVVDLRFFGGLSVEETAEALEVSTITVMRDWALAKAWLYRELSGQGDPSGHQ
jgi:RNA polymerase sigma-70 factor, ECF subfamily